jgi:hypothetical protein
VFLKVKARNLGIRFYANKLEAHFKCDADSGMIMHAFAGWQETSADTS